LSAALPTFAQVLDALRREDLLLDAPRELPEISGITTDSRTVVPGVLYAAVRGSETDGHRFVADAGRRGAVAAMVEVPQEAALAQVLVRDGRRAALAAARAWHGDPSRQLVLIGVTGTNGKTTTTGLLRHLLNGAGTAGSIGTLGAYDGTGAAVPSAGLTTPGPVDLQATLAALRDRGTTHVVMETSSHSLDQGRVDGLTFAAGVFTNLTRDHLDYHGSMEHYLAAKLRLSSYLALDGIEVVNLDDPVWRAMPDRNGRVTFGQHPAADVRASGLAMDAAGSRFRLESRWGSAEVALPLLGDFNVANALAAAACALGMGRPIGEVAQRLAAAPQVPGRMERIAGRPCVVLRDYAHTPDALERALATLRPLTAGKLIVVFGCGGDRDRGKRPIMGRIAAELADLAVVTSDNPRTEDPDAIIHDIEEGMGSVPHLRETDRREAIAVALQAAGPDDTVLLAGKGHETYQVIGTEKVPFDEREIVRALVGA
jgi:UDP-N-acetylmuramoyl-L-alanyl-D-glutamate--2,6-diaminopimelate ligase